VRLEPKAGPRERFHRVKNVDAVSHVRFRDHGAPALLGLDPDLERATAPVALENRDVHGPRSPPTPPRAEPLELLAEVRSIEQVRERRRGKRRVGGSVFARHRSPRCEMFVQHTVELLHESRKVSRQTAAMLPPCEPLERLME